MDEDKADEEKSQEEEDDEASQRFQEEESKDGDEEEEESTQAKSKVGNFKSCDCTTQPLTLHTHSTVLCF